MVQDDMQDTQTNVVVKQAKKKRRNIQALLQTTDVNKSQKSSSTHVSQKSSVGNFSDMVSQLTLEMSEVVGGQSNAARYDQIHELTIALKEALENNGAAASDAQAKIAKLTAAFRLTLDSKNLADEEILNHLEEQQRLERIIASLEDELMKLRKDPNADDKQLDLLETELTNIQKRMKDLEKELVKKNDIIENLLEKLKRPPVKDAVSMTNPQQELKEVKVLRKKVVALEGNMALEKAKPAKEVLAGRQQQDLSEDILVISYLGLPVEIASGSLRAWIRLTFDEVIQTTTKFKFYLIGEKQVKTVKKVNFGVEIFGPIQKTYDFEWIITSKRSGMFEIDITDYPVGKYKINIIPTDAKKYTNYIVVLGKELWEIEAKAIPKVDCSYQFVDRSVQILQSKKQFELGVLRTSDQERFTFSYRSESTTGMQSFYNQSGWNRFLKGERKSSIKLYLDQKPQSDKQHSFDVWLIQDTKGSQCACEIGALSRITVTVINDLTWTYVYFTEIQAMSFNYIDRCALVEVSRSHSHGEIDIPWEATRVDNSRIWKEGIWQQMGGHVKFINGQLTAYIQIDFPSKTFETGNIEEGELKLLHTQKYNNVKVQADRSLRLFQIKYVTEEIVERRSMLTNQGTMYKGSVRSESVFLTEKTHKVPVLRRESNSSSESNESVVSYRNVQTLSGVIRHDARIVSQNQAEITWPNITSDFIQGFVIIWWPRFKMEKNYSKLVDNKTFQCVIELFEENTEYEILVIPETSSRPIVRYSVENRFTESFIQDLIGPKVLSNAATPNITVNESVDESFRSGSYTTSGRKSKPKSNRHISGRHAVTGGYQVIPSNQQVMQEIGQVQYVQKRY